MELKDIVSISGKPGLHKIIGQRNNGLIVESLDGSGKRFPTSLAQKVSILADISIYTSDGDVPLGEVLMSLHKQVGEGLGLVSRKDSGEDIRSFFGKVLPDYDPERVYTSDIVKIASWYEMLKDQMDMTHLMPEEEEGEETPSAEEEE